MDEILKELDEIEAKYTPKISKKCAKIPLHLHENLAVLSKEFDSLGLPMVNQDQTLQEVLQQVVITSRNLVQIHRNSVDNIKDKNIEKVSRDNKHKELYEKLENYQENIDKLQTKCSYLQNTKLALNEQIQELQTHEKLHKREIVQIKRSYYSKQHQLEHNINKLQLEIGQLKKMCLPSKDKVAFELLQKHKLNEEIYKETIKALQDNNQALLEEIFNLKEELVLVRALATSDVI